MLHPEISVSSPFPTPLTKCNATSGSENPQKPILQVFTFGTCSATKCDKGKNLPLTIELLKLFFTICIQTQNYSTFKGNLHPIKYSLFNTLTGFHVVYHRDRYILLPLHQFELVIIFSHISNNPSPHESLLVMFMNGGWVRELCANLELPAVLGIVSGQQTWCASWVHLCL